MKMIFAMLLVLLSVRSFANSTNHLFVPEGYDTNDHVEVIVTGRLTNLCQRTPTFDIDREGKVFSVYLNFYQVPQDSCRRINISYMEKLNLGVLPAGEYVVRLMDFRTLVEEKIVKVEESVSSLQDNFNYGNVTGIRELGDGKVELLGTNPVNCLVFDRLESNVQGKMIVLLPHFKEEGECEEEPKSFSIIYQIPRQLHGEILLHVRVMDGRSYNYSFRK